MCGLISTWSDIFTFGQDHDLCVATENLPRPELRTESKCDSRGNIDMQSQIHILYHSQFLCPVK